MPEKHGWYGVPFYLKSRLELFFIWYKWLKLVDPPHRFGTWNPLNFINFGLFSYLGYFCPILSWAKFECRKVFCIYMIWSFDQRNSWQLAQWPWPRFQNLNKEADKVLHLRVLFGDTQSPPHTNVNKKTLSLHMRAFDLALQDSVEKLRFLQLPARHQPSAPICKNFFSTNGITFYHS